MAEDRKWYVKYRTVSGVEFWHRQEFSTLAAARHRVQRLLEHPGVTESWYMESDTPMDVDSAVYTLTDRGEWQAGVEYRPLDFVTESGKTLLCLDENKSSSTAVLKNARFWVQINLPNLEEA